MGMLSYVNDYAARPMETLHFKVVEPLKVFYLFFNCKKSSIEDAFKHKIGSDKVEVSYY